MGRIVDRVLEVVDMLAVVVGRGRRVPITDDNTAISRCHVISTLLAG